MEEEGMTGKYVRPAGAYAGVAGLANASKYQDDAAAVPKRAISSAKVDGDLNYIIEALNAMDVASGTRGSIAERLDVAFNADGTLKQSVAASVDDWLVQAESGVLARVDGATVTLGGGDFTALYQPGTRVRLSVGGAYVYADVASASANGGVTTLGLAGVMDALGEPAVIGSAPTEIAYGPLRVGAAGNMVRRFEDGVTVPADGVDFKLARDGADLAVLRDGVAVARFDANGVSGVTVADIGLGQLAAETSARLVPSGALMPFAGASAPTGWLLCDGSAVSRSAYADLFAAIGTAYGAGDGSTTFALPDLRGRAVFGVDAMGGTAASRITSGISGIDGATLGAVGGDERMQAHGHGVTVTDPDFGVRFPSVGSGVSGYYMNAGWVNGTYTSTVDSTMFYKKSAGSVVIADSGSGTAQNMPPAMMMNYIIKV
ncbi:MAG: tail fiber protein [Pseudomonadaceae bacterium]|nr:tail fiber protein [Pseudomonadaceae bacterium]